MIVLNMLTIAVFVYGAHKAIHHTADFFDIDLDFITEHDFFGNQRPLWQRVLARPLFMCNVCMCSVWGTLGYVALEWFNGFTWNGWLLTIIGAVTFVTAFNALAEGYDGPMQ